MRTARSVGAVFVTCLVVASCSDQTLVTPDAPDALAVTDGSVTPFAVTAALEFTPIEELGDEIFDDMDLSINKNQSCASCHDEEWGSTGPDQAINAAGAVYEGSIPGAFGDRKPPSAYYAAFSPVLHVNNQGDWVGGSFWDGRATGEELGSPAADQAGGPFLNLKEQALRDEACVVYRVAQAVYSGLYEEVFGDAIFDIDYGVLDVDALCGEEGPPLDLAAPAREAVEEEFDNIALAIAEYELSPVRNPFDSKFDLARRDFTKQERQGRALFNGKGKCSRCHTSNGKQPLFTDFTYDNLGVPANPENPFYLEDPDFVDLGLGGFLGDASQDGKVKVPTLRNVDQRPNPGDVKAYTHNGYFKRLKDVVHFYNTRDAKPTCPGPYTAAEAIAADCWPAPEVAENVNRDELGDLGLSEDEEWAIVAFLKTLTDGSMH
jgi:cytochrome c peroxidase